METAREIRHHLCMAIDALERAYDANIVEPNPAAAAAYLKAQSSLAARHAIKVVRLARIMQAAAPAAAEVLAGEPAGREPGEPASGWVKIDGRL